MNEISSISTPEFFLNQIKDAGLWLQDDLVEKNIPQEILSLVSREVAECYQVMPIKIDDSNPEILVMAAYNEQSFKDCEQIKRLVGRQVRILFADEDNVKSALSFYYKVNGTTGFKHRIESVDVDITPLKRKINGMIQDAIQKRASDIHMLPTDDNMWITFRISGHLVDVSPEYVIHSDEVSNAINIIKAMDKSGQANTGNQNMPNQGSFVLHRGDLLVDVRLSTVPIANGSQKVDLRLLPQTKSRVSIDKLGYLPEDLKVIRTTLLKAASGMFLNSGPTGHGKTTSLYAQIYDVLKMAEEPLNIMTIEDPVELYEPKFCQVQVRDAPTEELSLTAPKILKVGLRQDPDIFLYGEIRDKKDAEVAIEASLTGHKLFSTIHARNCVTTIARLINLGVSKSSLLSELTMIISQRLVGVLCEHCSVEHKLSAIELMVLDDDEIKYLSSPGVHLRSRGSIEAVKKCPYCSGNGFKGRVAVAEYVVFDMDLRDALLDQVNFSKIQKILRGHGFRTMWEKGLDMVVNGQTDLMEIIHTIGKN